MLNRTISLILSLVMCLSLTACGNNDSPEIAAKPESTASLENNSTQEKDEIIISGVVSESESSAALEKDSTQEPENEQVAVYEPERSEIDTLSWDFDSSTGTLSIHGSGPMRTFINSDPEWSVHKDEIRTVIVDDGITSVGAYAFSDFRSLTEVRLPDSVEVIDVCAFDYDWELRTITIPASLKYIGYRAFYNTLLWEPNDLIFPEGIEYIGDYAFHSALKSGGIVSLPSSLKYLGKQAFTNAYLSDFLISEGNPYYCTDNQAIYTKDMRELLMLAPVTDGIGEFRIPDGVESICEECFNVIHGISTVYIPASVTDIAEGAFFSTFDLKEIIVDEANSKYKSENGLLLSKDGTLLLAWPDGIQSNELIIPDGVERLSGHLFYGRFDEDYTVVLPESVRELGTMSLPYSIALLSLPNSLEKVDANVFYDGISVDAIYYNGTEADWGRVTIEDGNGGLNTAAINWNS